jgi:dihydroorotase
MKTVAIKKLMQTIQNMERARTMKIILIHCGTAQVIRHNYDRQAQSEATVTSTKHLIHATSGKIYLTGHRRNYQQGLP